MPFDSVSHRAEPSVSDVSHMKLDEELVDEEAARQPDVKVEHQYGRLSLSPSPPTLKQPPHKVKNTSASQSPMKLDPDSRTPMEEDESVETVGGDVALKVEPAKPSTLSRSKSQKVVARPPILYSDEPDKTAEACSSFQVIDGCEYANKHIGTTEPAFECDCDPEYDSNGENQACGEQSDCINRLTKMECVGDCHCGTRCGNQRFQNREFANVTVFKTEKKGYGLRTDSDLRPGDFIFEYIGEVIGEASFRRRTVSYSDEGIKHFYFMSLTKDAFVDATKKGNLGRFCNHSCNPNCYVDKWVVGDRLRMGIFAERFIKAGEELVFNYNVDRYGADPQPCYCGEPNCTGFLGGKTQTERATKLSNAVIEALGIDDGDGWDTAYAKKPRKKRRDEDDEEYVESLQPKSLDSDAVTNLMATLMQCKEKWIAVKLLGRVQRCDDQRVRDRIVKMHGYRILKTTLETFIDDVNVVLQAFDILLSFTRITRNKIEESKIEDTVSKLKENADERVKEQAVELLEIWSKLEMGYRIPRQKRDPNAAPAARLDRRERPTNRQRSRSRSRSLESANRIVAPSGPRGNAPQRGWQRPPPRPRPQPQFNRDGLPEGWFSAVAENNKTYYYSVNGETKWERPMAPVVKPPPPPKQLTHEQKLQEIINGIIKKDDSATPNEKSAAATPVQDTPKKTEKSRKLHKWETWPVEKQKKMYENTIFPHITYVCNKFRDHLPKDELKKHAKFLSKKLVESDYKHNRVKDPTKTDEKREQDIKKFSKEYLKKAAIKRKEYEKQRAARKAKEAKQAKQKGLSEPGSHTPTEPVPDSLVIKREGVKDEDEGKADLSDDDMGGISDDEEKSTKNTSPMDDDPPASPDLKRKRELDDTPASASTPQLCDDDESPRSPKKQKAAALPPPPPPPPPPESDDKQDAMDVDAAPGTEVKVEDSAEYTYRPAKMENGHLDGHPSPMQLATPSTNGSYPFDAEKKMDVCKEEAHLLQQDQSKRGISNVA